MFKFRKVVAYFLTLAIVVGIAPIALQAQEPLYDSSENGIYEVLPPDYEWEQILSELSGYINIEPMWMPQPMPPRPQGTGTAASPFRITNTNDLRWMAWLVNQGTDMMGFPAYTSRHFRLENNITAPPDWTPIGTPEQPFRGTFNGNFNTISGLTQSLFGMVFNNAVIENVGVININLGITGGGIADFMGNATIRNSWSTGTISASGGFAGGIVGHLSSGTIINSFSTVQFGHITNSVGPYVGGIVGAATGNIRVENTYATGQIPGNLGQVNGGHNLAGIVGGFFEGGGNKVVQNNVALNPVVRARTQHGRIVGGGTFNLGRNHALNTMATQNGAAFSAARGHNTVNGADITMAQALTASFWTTTTDQWTAWDTSVWYISNGQLPLLRAGGTPPAPNSEATPTATIDFINERLIGLQDGAHTINGNPVTVANGSVAIQNEWMGTTLAIIKVGATPAQNSEAQTLAVPPEPPEPIVNSVDESGPGAYNGRIIGVSTDMEYRPINTTVWSNVTGNEITGLASGVYQVRYRATATAFSSEIENVNVGNANLLLIFELSMTAGSVTYNGVVDQQDRSITFTIPESKLTSLGRFTGHITGLEMSPGATALRFFVNGAPHAGFGISSYAGFSSLDSVEAMGAPSLEYRLYIEPIPTPVVPVEIREFVLRYPYAAGVYYHAVIDHVGQTITFTIPENKLWPGTGRFEGFVEALDLYPATTTTLDFRISGAPHNNFGLNMLVGFSNGDSVIASGAPGIEYDLIIIPTPVFVPDTTITQITFNGVHHGIIDNDGATITFHIPEGELDANGRFVGTITALGTSDNSLVRFFVGGGEFPGFGVGSFAGFSSGDAIEAMGGQAIEYEIVIIPV